MKTRARKPRIIALQFSFPKESDVPSFVQGFKVPTGTQRGVSAPGKLIIPQTEGVSVEPLLDDMAHAKYRLVDVMYEVRSSGSKPRHLAKFIFSPKRSKVSPSPEVIRMAEFLIRDLDHICSSALWRDQAYVNPFLDKTGKRVSGVQGVSVVMDARQPFVQGDGQPVTIREKDEVTGERKGTPLPLSPSYRLHLTSNYLPTLISA